MNSRFAITVLASAILAATLMIPPTVNAAEPVTLSCRGNEGAGVWTYRITYASRLFEMVGSNNAALWSTTARVSDNTISWSFDAQRSDAGRDGIQRQITRRWEGQIDRLSGAGGFREYDLGSNIPDMIAVNCSAAAQKF